MGDQCDQWRHHYYHYEPVLKLTLNYNSSQSCCDSIFSLLSLKSIPRCNTYIDANKGGVSLFSLSYVTYVLYWHNGCLGRYFILYSHRMFYQTEIPVVNYSSTPIVSTVLFLMLVTFLPYFINYLYKAIYKALFHTLQVFNRMKRLPFCPTRI